MSANLLSMMALLAGKSPEELAKHAAQKFPSPFQMGLTPEMLSQMGGAQGAPMGAPGMGSAQAMGATGLPSMQDFPGMGGTPGSAPMPAMPPIPPMPAAPMPVTPVPSVPGVSMAPGGAPPDLMQMIASGQAGPEGGMAQGQTDPAVLAMMNQGMGGAAPPGVPDAGAQNPAALGQALLGSSQLFNQIARGNQQPLLAPGNPGSPPVPTGPGQSPSLDQLLALIQQMGGARGAPGGGLGAVLAGGR